MAIEYSQYDVISADTYNEMVNRANQVWGPGVGQYGYGQPLIPTVSPGDTINFTPLITTLSDIADHQNRGLSFDINQFDLGDTVKFLSGIEQELGDLESGSFTDGLAYTQRFKFNPVNHTVTAGASNSRTYTNGWGNTDNGLRHEITITFTSNDHAETFFNAGGFIKPYVSSANASAATTDVNWAAIINTVAASELTFNGPQFSTNNPTYPGSTSAGFHDLPNTNSYVQAFNMTPSSYATESYNLRIKRQDNVVTFEIEFRTVSGGDVNLIDVTSGVSIGTPADASFTNVISAPTVSVGTFTTL